MNNITVESLESADLEIINDLFAGRIRTEDITLYYRGRYYDGKELSHTAEYIEWFATSRFSPANNFGTIELCYGGCCFGAYAGSATTELKVRLFRPGTPATFR